MQREVGIMYLGGSGDEGWELMENCLSVNSGPTDSEDFIHNIVCVNILHYDLYTEALAKNKIFIRMYRMHDVELHLE